MKTRILLLCFLLSTFCFSQAATMYPVLTDNSTRTFSGGGTNLALLNGTNTFAGTNIFGAGVHLSSSLAVLDASGIMHIKRDAAGTAAKFTRSDARGHVQLGNNIGGGDPYSLIDVTGPLQIRINGTTSFLELGRVTDVLGFAGTTASEPGLKRSGATLQVRLADDSSDAALRTGPLSALVGGSTAYAKVGGVVFAQTTTNATTNVDGTEDDLYSVTLAANTFSADLQSVVQVEHVNLVSSATAARRVKRYFGGTLIFDSGALTLAAGGDFTINTHLIRHSSSVVMALVEVASTSASTVPYVTATTVSGLTLSNSQILKTTGIASGAGAAASDITNDRIIGKWYPAP